MDLAEVRQKRLTKESYPLIVPVVYENRKSAELAYLNVPISNFLKAIHAIAQVDWMGRRGFGLFWPGLKGAEALTDYNP